jgi:hypothetical protein
MIKSRVECSQWIHEVGELSGAGAPADCQCALVACSVFAIVRALPRSSILANYRNSLLGIPVEIAQSWIERKEGVSVLEKDDTLCSDLTSDLPALVIFAIDELVDDFLLLWRAATFMRYAIFFVGPG